MMNQPQAYFCVRENSYSKELCLINNLVLWLFGNHGTFSGDGESFDFSKKKKKKKTLHWALFEVCDALRILLMMLSQTGHEFSSNMQNLRTYFNELRGPWMVPTYQYQVPSPNRPGFVNREGLRKNSTTSCLWEPHKAFGRMLRLCREWCQNT